MTLAVEGLEVKQHYEESYVTGCAKPAAHNYITLNDLFATEALINLWT